MGIRRRGWALAEFWLAWTLMLGMLLTVEAAMQAQTTPAIAITQVSDIVYRADGTPAGGTVLISWPAFSTLSGASVPAGSTSVTIGAGGVLSVGLAANAGSTPMGSYYTVVYHLNDGSVTREYWVVPVSTATVAVSAIRSTVLPASVAMQTVSKSYVDTQIAQALGGSPLDSSAYVQKSGDTMTGPLVLPGDPTAPLQASDKNYVDVQIAGVTGGGGQKVSLLPQATQIVTQPAGTELAVNDLNSVLYASQYVSGAGNNGIANATASCTAGCDVVAEQTYPAAEVSAPTTWSNQTHVDDRRGGVDFESFLNPLPPQTPGFNAAKTINVDSTQSAQSVLAATGGSEIFSSGMVISSNALAGGSNTFPSLIQGTVPYFKTTFNGLTLNGTNYTVGQHNLFDETQNCYGVGDCLMGGMFMQASGGFRDDADEGSHPFDRVFTEDTRVFVGSCTQGCTTGSTVLQVTASSNSGTQGEGRYLVNTNSSKAITSGTLTGAGSSGGRQPAATFAGTSFPVSVFLETAQVIPTQSNSMNPGTVAVSIATAGVPTGFATSTAALPGTSGVACVSDVAVSDQRPLNFETAAYVTIDGSHLRMNLNRPHASGATIAIGGLCGYGLEQKVDTLNGIRQIFPVIGSDTPTSLLYAGGATAIIGLQGQTSAYVNVSLAVASIARANNVVTVTTAANLPQDLTGLTLTVQNVADTSYNGSYVVTSTGPNTLTYAETGSVSSSTGGTLSLVTGAYGLYPMAEVLSVYNATTKAVDGQMTLAANNVNWAAGDPVEEPHYFQEAVSGDTDAVTQFTPRATRPQSAGISYGGNNSAGLTGWTVSNSDPASSYFGNGGTHTPPDDGMKIQGIWKRSMETQAGESAVFDVHCNSHGCGKWNSTYDLFELDTATGQDRIRYAPSTSNLDFYLLGTDYNFSPQGFTAGTINVTTLNAATIQGLFQGTIGASSLPVFVGSGSGHQVGAVPDPGAAAGITRYLREDGAWVAPTGASQLGSTNGANSLPQTASLIGEYLLTEGSGTLMHDSSGNGNNATLGTGSAAPAWTSTGLAFTGADSVSLPAALNATQTMIFGLYIRPLSNSANHVATSSILVTNTVGNTDLQLILQSTYPGSNNNDIVDSAFGANIFAGGSVTASAFTASGYHTLAVSLGTCGTSLDRIFFDGQEVAYTVQGCSAGKQTSGNLLLGGNPAVWGATAGLPGVLYLAAFYSTVLSPDQIASASGIIRNAVAARGAAVEPIPTPLTSGALNVAGDSITFGFPNLIPYSALLVLQNPPTTGINNWGISGITLEAITGSEDNRVGPLCKSSTGPAVYTIFAGTNDFLNIPSATAPTVFAMLTGDIQKMKTAGCRVGVVTMVSRVGNGTAAAGASFDVDKRAFNTLILNGAKAAGADFIVDVAANPFMGADGAYANTTYFQADGTHPTQAGQQIIANAYSNAYNYTFGHNKSNPDVITAGTYQMLSSDGALSLASTAAQAVTMPDCTGPSGAVYYLNNSTAIAKTVVGGTNQPINGLTSPFTIPANSSLALYDVPNPETVSGCHWEF